MDTRIENLQLVNQTYNALLEKLSNDLGRTLTKNEKIELLDDDYHITHTSLSNKDYYLTTLSELRKILPSTRSIYCNITNNKVLIT